MGNGIYLNSIKIPFIEFIKFKVLRYGIKRKYYIKIIKDNNLLNEAFHLRYNVYCKELNYLNPSDFKNGIEKDVYDDYAINFALMTKKDNKLIGTVRLVKSNSNGLPIEKEFELKINNFNMDDTQEVEISRLCIEKKYRRTNIGNNNALLAILKALYSYAKKENYNNLLAAIDKNVFEMLKKIGFSFTILGTSKYYMGSKSIPVMINLEHESMWLKIVNPVLWKFLNS
jgi:N-acyl-L-homoserine lactone synthetase